MEMCVKPLIKLLANAANVTTQGRITSTIIFSASLAIVRDCVGRLREFSTRVIIECQSKGVPTTRLRYQIKVR